VLLRTSHVAWVKCAGAPSCILSGITPKLNVSRHMLIWTFFHVLVCTTHAQSLSAPFSYNLYSEIILDPNANDKPLKWKRQTLLPSNQATEPQSGSGTDIPIAQTYYK
jgi:hypothetical protein